MKKKKAVNGFAILGRQFQNALIYLLIAASVISFIIKDYSDGIVILIILAINTSLGFFQEYKSERIIQKLETFISKVVRVKRNGEIVLLDENDIVVGDIVILHEGDIAPADMNVTEVDDVEVDESALTGESAFVTKAIDGKVYEGSIIQKGEVTGTVTAIGDNTEFGTIVRLSEETKKETEYERSLKSFSTFLLKTVLLALVVIFFAKLFLNKGSVSTTILLIFVISMAIVVVPEVLPVIATVSLSSGALRLAKKHVVVKRLSSVEDLGNISVLCTDKTGTITENKMAIQTIVSDEMELFQLLASATIATLKNRKRRVMDAYDDAFIGYVPKELQDKAKCFVIMKELPFDPTDKRRRVVVHDKDADKYYLVSIGAPEILLDISKSDKKADYLQTISKEGENGLRHVGIAYKTIAAYTEDYDIAKDENNLTFLGYASLTDPLRPGAKATIEEARGLGIHIKVLTGDSKEVATYVGREVGLVTDTSRVYSGDELETLSPEEFKKAVTEHHIFARVTPTQKFAIIKALKESFVVGYQGDGINDAPALKLADVAIAVNTATDIAKDSADIVLLNKDLQVIVNGIRYGRTIFVNINKYITYTMVNNFGSFMALAVLYLFSHDLPLLPIQVLLTNVLTDIPLITIYSDTVENSDIVKPQRHNIKELLFISLMLGVPTALFELLYYMVIRSQPLPVIQTSLYAFFTFTALIVFYAFRNKSYFWKSKMPSGLLNLSFLLTFIISFGIIYIPVIQHAFHFVPLRLSMLAGLVGVTLIYFFILDQMKVWYYGQRF
ncbi:MAG TPA: cation-transporting P-type ATPase [Candidatus Paceibacterota bacterium]|jgi:Mg2+-importing ATPase|nr:cation-transporting P-type ATPase [Candidatus Paceibacterota bacterium]